MMHPLVEREGYTECNRKDCVPCPRAAVGMLTLT
jgi:hypothetical protein